MTENSDFVARYLRSDDDDRPEHLTAPLVGDEPANDQSVKAVEPETLKPAERHPPGLPATTGGHEDGVTDPGHLDGDAGSPASFEGWLSEADTGPQPQIGGGPPTGPRSAPVSLRVSLRAFRLRSSRRRYRSSRVSMRAPRRRCLAGGLGWTPQNGGHPGRFRGRPIRRLVGTFNWTR